MPKHLLHLLSQLQHSGRSRTAGFSMVLVILIALAVLLGGVMLIARVSFGQLGSAYQSQGREAREAAEIGMARIIAELNRERNRRLLVNAPIVNNQDRTYLESSTNQGQLRSVCTLSLPNLANTFPSTNLKAEQTLDAQRRYQLISISQPTSSSQTQASSPYAKNSGFTVSVGYDPSGTASPAQNPPTSQPPLAGELTLTVRGTAYRNGVLVASSTLTRTLEVVPKCCRGSLGGYREAFGNDNRACANSLGFGLVGGAAENDTGVITVQSTSSDIVDGYGNNIEFVYCVATTNCSANINTNVGTLVNVVDIDMPDVKTAANTTCDKAVVGATLPAACNINLDDNSIGVGGTLTLTTPVDASWPTNFRNVCSASTPSGASLPLTTCSINQLDFGKPNRTLKVNSIGGPMRMHFPNSQAGGNTKTVDQRSGGGFLHVNSANPGEVPTKITDFTLFGCQSCTPEQLVDLGQGGGAALRFFAYFPHGAIEIGGSSGYAGVIWTDKVKANGNVTMTIPGSGLGDVLDLMGMGGTTPSVKPPLVDYVLRATRSLQFF
ncbi:hypothetical protein [Vulcanococcus limneticus]|uniref:hypothetical protein n=1 Tax=Vulcanococcus limneticus TaxID=2170428 RepID=UPI00398BDA3A